MCFHSAVAAANLFFFVYVRCAEVEALIQCRRYDDALQAADCFKPGVTKLYLEAEVVWRDGDPAAASRPLTVCSDGGTPIRLGMPPIGGPTELLPELR